MGFEEFLHPISYGHGDSKPHVYYPGRLYIVCPDSNGFSDCTPWIALPLTKSSLTPCGRSRACHGKRILGLNSACTLFLWAKASGLSAQARLPGGAQGAKKESKPRRRTNPRIRPKEDPFALRESK